MRTLEKIAGLRHTLGLIEVSTESGNILDAVELLRRLRMNMEAWESVQERSLLVFYRRTRRIFATASLRVYQAVGIHFDMFILQFQPYLSANKYRVGAQQSCQYPTNRCQGPTILPGNVITCALPKLGLLEETILSFGHNFDKFVLIPRLQMPQRGTIHVVYVEDNAIGTADKLTDLSIEKLFADMSLLVSFLHSNLPGSIMDPLAALVTPNLIQLIVTN